MSSEVKYTYLWRNKWITSACSSIDEFIDTFEELAEKLKQWKELGVELDETSGISNDYASFYTFNSETAEDLDFEPEEEQEDEWTLWATEED